MSTHYHLRVTEPPDKPGKSSKVRTGPLALTREGAEQEARIEKVGVPSREVEIVACSRECFLA